MPVVRDGRRQRTTYDVELVGSGGAGPVQRRAADEGERNGFASRAPAGGLPPAVPRPSSAGACPHGMYGTVRCYSCDPLEPEPSPVIFAYPREVPVMAIEPRPPAPEPLPVVVTHGDDHWNRQALTALQAATTEALAAWEGLLEVRAAEQRWVAACEALEAAWSQTGLRGGPTSIDHALEALKLGVELGRADSGLSDGLADDSSVVTRRPETPATPAGDQGRTAAETRRAAVAAGGGPDRSPLPPKQARILATVARLKGDRKAAAAELGVTVSNVENQLESVGRKGLLPIELIPLLPARFAKYSGTSR